MNEMITIQGVSIPIKEYNGQRVVTFKDIDLVHARPTGTARKRFNDNKERFIGEVDYFKITPSEFRTAIGTMDKRQRNDITLITETGYLMLVKSFTDDLAWCVQRELVNSYFRGKELYNKFLQVNEEKIVIHAIRPKKITNGSQVIRISAEQYNTLAELSLISGRAIAVLASELLDFALNHVEVKGEERIKLPEYQEATERKVNGVRINEEKFKFAVAKKCIKYKDLAESIGISRQTLSTIIHGRQCRPDTAGKIAKILSVEVNEIFDVD